MHFRTHPAAKHKGKSNGQGDYNDVMVAHDEHIGQMLAKLDELGIADDTIVMYSTDNGPHYNSWPDAGITPFRSEKNTNWEGGWRVPAFVRWPRNSRRARCSTASSAIRTGCRRCSPRRARRTSRRSCTTGHKVGDKTFKVHIDGIDMLPYLTGEAKESPRNFFFYISDDGDILAIRMKDWKVVLMEQRAKQLMCWFEPFVKLRAPKIFNLRRDPFERADENSNTYWDWVLSHVYIVYAMQAIVANQIAEFREVPAAPEARLVQPRRRHADAAGDAQQRRPLSPRTRPSPQAGEGSPSPVAGEGGRPRPAG